MSNLHGTGGTSISCQFRHQSLPAFLLVVAALVIADLAIAEASEPDANPVEFNIPAQAVPAALGEFARQARVQLFFISDGFEGIQANAVDGSYPLQQALDLLLEGTGLAATYSAESGVKVRPVSASMDTLIRGSQQLTAVAADATDEGWTGAPSRSRRAANSDESDFETVPRKLEEIVVTGSRIRGAQGASPVVTITRQEIDRSGFSTVEEIVEKLPQNFGAGASQAGYANPLFSDDAVGGSVGDFVGGTSVNLRGLGASSTLVLFNGRRMSPSGRSASFTDISGIPVTAIERIEVLTDGASAIYGSDAIGGVVNFIMRDDYDGAETRLRYGSDSGGDTSEVLLGQSFGISWDRGSMLLSYEYFHHDNLANIDRSFAASNDLTQFGGDDFRTLGGNPANVMAGGQMFAIPPGQDGTSLTASDFDPEAPLNRHSFLEAQDMLPAQEHHSGFLSLSQQLGATELFTDVRISSRRTKTRRSTSTADITVPGDDPLTPQIEGNPFFVDPTGTGLTSVVVRGYSFADDIGPTISEGESDSYSAALGVRFGMGEAWHGELTGNWSRQEASLTLSNAVDREALTAAVAQTDPELAFNPFGDGSSTNPAVLDTLRTNRRVGVLSENDLRSISLTVDGAVLEAPGGLAQLAAGAEMRRESLFTVDPPASDELPIPSIDDSRDIRAVYAELFLPLVGPDNRRSAIHRLDLSLAARYEDYSDFGNSTNPKLGLVWSPAQSVVLRGTWGTSFRAPQLTDLNTASASNVFLYLPQFFVDIGAIPLTTLVMQGANGSLRPEKATTWTAGIEWRPPTINGLLLDITYFNVDFKDRIDVPFLSLTDGYAPRFASLLNTNPTSDQIAAIANDPRYEEVTFAGTTPAEDLLSGAAPVGAIMDRRVNNLSKSIVSGLELQASLEFDTAIGEFDLGLNGNYLLDFKRALLATDPLIDEVDTLGRPVDLRARAQLTWTRAAWSISGFVNYTDGYTDNVSAPARPVDSWTTVDLTVAYDTGDVKNILSDTRISLTAQNLFDEDPPFVNTFGGLAYDVTNANGLGQFLRLQAIKEW